jgi:hypothetical protein
MKVKIRGGIFPYGLLNLSESTGFAFLLSPFSGSLFIICEIVKAFEVRLPDYALMHL